MSWQDAYDLHEQEWESFEELRASFEWEFPDEFNTAQFICDRWTEGPDRIAAYYEDETAETQGQLTFGELKTHSDRLAEYLASRGIEKGDRVAINVPSKIETLISHIAVWKLGAVSVPLSVLFGPDGLEYRLKDSESSVAIIDEANIDPYRAVANHIDSIEETLVVGDVQPHDRETRLWAAIEQVPGDIEPAKTAVDDEMLLMYTSGTTGDSKGVLHAHRATIGHLPGIITNFYNLEVTDGDVMWCPIEYSWAGTLTFILAAWSFGVPLVAHESGGSFDPAAAFSLIERYDVTLALIPPSGLRMLMQVDSPGEEYEVTSMRNIASGGEKVGDTIPEWVRDVFDASINELYGQTEIWNIILGNCQGLAKARPGWLGYEIPGHEVEIVEPGTAETLAPGEIGEITVRRDDPTLLKRYWNKPDETDDLYRGDWVLTGDLGKRTEDGEFMFVSRKDDVIISSGYRIGPEEVEDSLTAHPAVADAGVIGVEDDVRGTVPKAFVVLTEGYAPSDDLEETIKTHVRERLAAYEYPRHIEFVEELPCTTTGKVRRADLRHRD